MGRGRSGGGGGGRVPDISICLKKLVSFCHTWFATNSKPVWAPNSLKKTTLGSSFTQSSNHKPPIQNQPFSFLAANGSHPRDSHLVHFSQTPYVTATTQQGGRRNSAQTTAPYSCAALRAGPWDLQGTVSRDFDTCPRNSAVPVRVAYDVPGYKVESLRCLLLGILESLILQNLVIRTGRAGLRYPFHVQTQPQLRVKR